MEGLPLELYLLCRQVFLDCDKFESYQVLRGFCSGVDALYPLKIKLKQASSCEALVESNLPIFMEYQDRRYGWGLLVLVKILREICPQEDSRWHQIDSLYIQLQEIMVKRQTVLATISQTDKKSEHKLFKIILRIDFDDQENSVKQAINKQSLHKRIAAFLVHGEEKFGQGTLVTRLLSQLRELQNGRQIKIPVGGMGDVSNLWNEVAKHFSDSERVALLTPEQIIERICECLQTQHLIFIFTEVHRTYIGFLSKLIQEFWQPLVEKANHKETYLVMFLIDNKGSVCQSDIPLAWDVNQSEYPAFPLHLPPASRFPFDKLEQWLGMAVAAELVPEDLSAETLLRESKGGIPELVYQKICYYCGCSWEGGLAKWLIQ
ncbi:MAG: hypothetical protein F6K21_02440 [Symploca sp. SIO2D2]|nr:hypothetical protein [Symploca sp. SIO2D2]